MQLIEKWKHLLEKINPYFFTIFFSFSFVVNILLYYSGMAFQASAVRRFLFIALSIIFFLTAFGCAIMLWKISKYIRKYLIVGMCICLLFLLGIVAGAIPSGFNFSRIEFIVQFFLYCIPAIILGVKAAYEPIYAEVVYDRISLFVVPAMITYLSLTLLPISPFHQNYLGIIDYLTISYGLLPLLVVAIFQYNYGTQGFAGFSLLGKLPNLRFWVCVFLWLTILASNGRGGIVCGLFFVVLYICYLRIKKQSIKKMVKMLALFMAMFFVIHVVYLPNVAKITSRFSIVAQSLVTGEIASANSSRDSDVIANIDELVASEDATDTTISQKEVAQSTTNRWTMYTLAIKEIQKNPLAGMGPMGFTNKYGFYPHNLFLEVFADLGVITGSMVSLFIIYIYFKLLLIALKDHKTAHLFLLLCAFSPMLMLSGTFWQSPILLFTVSFSLTTPWKNLYAIKWKG